MLINGIRITALWPQKRSTNLLFIISNKKHKRKVNGNEKLIANIYRSNSFPTSLGNSLDGSDMIPTTVNRKQ